MIYVRDELTGGNEIGMAKYNEVRRRGDMG
jgi:hypothetical protein